MQELCGCGGCFGGEGLGFEDDGLGFEGGVGVVGGFGFGLTDFQLYFLVECVLAVRIKKRGEGATCLEIFRLLLLPLRAGPHGWSD